MIFFSCHQHLPLLFLLILGLLHRGMCRHSHYRHSGKDPNARLLLTMQSYMNSSLDPCQDFYHYACGNWKNIHSDVTKYVDTIGSLDYIINQRLKFIMRRKLVISKTTTNEIYRKVHDYIETCEEQRKFDAIYYLHILKPLDDNDWPENGETWRPSVKWNVWTTLGRLQAVGFNGFPVTLELKQSNASHFFLELDKLYTLGYTVYEQSLIDKLEGSMDANTRRLAKNIQQFLNKLAVLNKHHQEFVPQEIMLKDLIKKVPSLDFLAFFSALLGDEGLDKLTLKVINLDYFLKLGDLVQKTSQDTLIYAIKLKFLGYLEKQMPKVDTRPHCMQHMRDLVPLALDYIYEQEVYRYERNTSDTVIRNVFQRIRQKFVEIIKQHNDEYSPPEIDFLKEKILKMKLNIGNLPTAAEKGFYREYFKSWQVIDNDFYWNHLSALQHYYTEKYNLLKVKSSSPQLTFFTWPYGSPAYQPSANLLIIPHAYLRYPLFHVKFHELFLYAELGNTLGHEIMHAFDINGLRYDSDGNPSALLLSSLPDKVKFLNSLECLTQERSFSLNEKIADISGFRLAYESYFDHGNVSKFPGPTALNNKQLFYIKFAQFFCALSPSHVSYDESHDTPFRRVPQVVANHAEFEEVFGCPRKKYEVKKCNLW